MRLSAFLSFLTTAYGYYYQGSPYYVQQYAPYQYNPVVYQQQPPAAVIPVQGAAPVQRLPQAPLRQWVDTKFDEFDVALRNLGDILVPNPSAPENAQEMLEAEHTVSLETTTTTSLEVSTPETVLPILLNGDTGIHEGSVGLPIAEGVYDEEGNIIILSRDSDLHENEVAHQSRPARQLDVHEQPAAPVRVLVRVPKKRRYLHEGEVPLNDDKKAAPKVPSHPKSVPKKKPTTATLHEGDTADREESWEDKILDIASPQLSFINFALVQPNQQPKEVMELPEEQLSTIDREETTPEPTSPPEPEVTSSSTSTESVLVDEVQHQEARKTTTARSHRPVTVTPVTTTTKHLQQHPNELDYEDINYDFSDLPEKDGDPAPVNDNQVAEVVTPTTASVRAKFDVERTTVIEEIEPSTVPATTENAPTTKKHKKTTTRRPKSTTTTAVPRTTTHKPKETSKPKTKTTTEPSTSHSKEPSSAHGISKLKSILHDHDDLMKSDSEAWKKGSREEKEEESKKEKEKSAEKDGDNSAKNLFKSLTHALVKESESKEEASTSTEKTITTKHHKTTKAPKTKTTTTPKAKSSTDSPKKKSTKPTHSQEVTSSSKPEKSNVKTATTKPKKSTTTSHHTTEEVEKTTEVETTEKPDKKHEDTTPMLVIEPTSSEAGAIEPIPPENSSTEAFIVSSELEANVEYEDDTEITTSKTATLKPTTKNSKTTTHTPTTTAPTSKPKSVSTPKVTTAKPKTTTPSLFSTDSAEYVDDQAKEEETVEEGPGDLVEMKGRSVEQLPLDPPDDLLEEETATVKTTSSKMKTKPTTSTTSKTTPTTKEPTTTMKGTTPKSMTTTRSSTTEASKTTTIPAKTPKPSETTTTAKTPKPSKTTATPFATLAPAKKEEYDDIVYEYVDEEETEGDKPEEGADKNIATEKSSEGVVHEDVQTPKELEGKPSEAEQNELEYEDEREGADV